MASYRKTALDQALQQPGISAGERLIVEATAPIFAAAWPAFHPISRRELMEMTGLHGESVTRGLRRAARHGFLVRDESRKRGESAAYKLADEWIVSRERRAV
jgi:DNA-binding transcriptional ArsR family regulator